jgi:hypothetical protein
MSGFVGFLYEESAAENFRALIRQVTRTGVSHRLAGVYEGNLRCSSGDGRHHPLDELPTFLARLEVENLLWRNFDSCSGFGLRPMRHRRWRVRKLPNPRISTFSPRPSACTMLSRIRSTMTVDSCRGICNNLETSFDAHHPWAASLVTYSTRTGVKLPSGTLGGWHGLIQVVVGPQQNKSEFHRLRLGDPRRVPSLTSSHTPRHAWLNGRDESTPTGAQMDPRTSAGAS